MLTGHSTVRAVSTHGLSWVPDSIQTKTQQISYHSLIRFAQNKATRSQSSQTGHQQELFVDLTFSCPLNQYRWS